MLDNQLVELFRPVIISGLAAQGLSQVVVRRGTASEQTATESAPVVTYFKLTDNQFGFRGAQNKWNVNTLVMNETEDQNVETTFQINGLKYQNPPSVGELTASDILNIVAGILQSRNFLRILKTANVGVYRIDNISNPNISDDYDQNEFCPSFDFTLTHHRATITEVPSTTKFNAGIYRE